LASGIEISLLLGTVTLWAFTGTLSSVDDHCGVWSWDAPALGDACLIISLALIRLAFHFLGWSVSGSWSFSGGSGGGLRSLRGSLLGRDGGSEDGSNNSGGELHFELRIRD